MTLSPLIERLEKAELSFDLNQSIACQEFYREEFGDMADDEVPDFGESFDAAIRQLPTSKD